MKASDVAGWQQKVVREIKKQEARDMLKPKGHSRHQVEQCKVLPQHIADWVDGRIAVSSYYV